MKGKPAAFVKSRRLAAHSSFMVRRPPRSKSYFQSRAASQEYSIPAPLSPPVTTQPKPCRLISEEISSSKGSVEIRLTASGRIGIFRSTSILFSVRLVPVETPSQTLGYGQSAGRRLSINDGRLIRTNHVKLSDKFLRLLDSQCKHYDCSKRSISRGFWRLSP